MTNELLQSPPDKSITHLVIKFQAHIRGYLLRKRISDRFTHFYDNIEKVKQLQAWWRNVLIRKYYKKLLKERVKHSAGEESYQFSSVKGKYESIMEWYKEQVCFVDQCYFWNHIYVTWFSTRIRLNIIQIYFWIFQEDKVIKIQALWRGRAARRAFYSLLRLDKPPLSVVRRFSAILNFNTEDYDKDLQLQVSFLPV